MMSGIFWTRILRRSAWLWAAVTIACAPRLAAAPSAGGAVLTTAAQVRALSEAAARRALPATLEGVVMGGADPAGIAFVIQDSTEGIYVQGPPNLVVGLRRGDVVRIEGVTDPGGFAPYVVAHSIRKLGTAPIPPPLKVSLEDLDTGQMDAKWIETTGIVRSVQPTAPSDSAPPPPGTRYTLPRRDAAPLGGAKTKLKLASGNSRLIVEVDGRYRPEDYVDAEVRLRGLCFNLHNRNRQFVRPFVQVPAGLGIQIVVPPPRDAFDSPVRPVASLFQFEHPAYRQGHRVHVRGVVIHHRVGSALWIRDHDHSIRVESTQREALQPGDVVDVLGFPAMSHYSAILEDAVFRKRASGPPPAPHVLAAVSEALRYDADLVQLDARLTELRRVSDSLALTLEWKGTAVRAQMHMAAGELMPRGWLPGSLVRVSGVCAVLTDEAGPLGGLWEPHSFQLLLRSPADLAVLRPPPWWTAERVVWVLAGFLVLALGAVAAVMLASRRRLKEQEHRRAMAETEFAAILAERNRVAREIHDTLSQSLGAISVQLELARTHAAEIGAPARKHIGTAHQLARAALAEARDSIWNMRSHVLERSDLGEALGDILNRMTEGTDTKPTMRVEGDRRRLPPVVENNLLRIGQEAITNACKYAKATRIDVTLAYEARLVRLSVVDNGAGFSTEAKPEGDHRSFGLVGMRERAVLLGGSVEIRSAPGEGTSVVATLPV